tara:strand:- start:2636 stop:3295 length:660 start_codon:yes stop_codon:yes gene_type:complete
MKLNLTENWKHYLVWFIVLLLFCRVVYGNIKTLNDYKIEMRKFKLENLSFEDEINERGERIISQEQIILSQKDAIGQGLLEVNRLKKIKSQVSVVTETIIDTFIVNHTDTIVEYRNGDAFLKLPQSYLYETEHLNFGAEISKIGLKVNNISIFNTSSVTIGYKSNGLFRKKSAVVEIQNSNPYVMTNSVGNVIIKEKQNPLTDYKVWGGVGFILGLLIN